MTSVPSSVCGAKTWSVAGVIAASKTASKKKEKRKDSNARFNTGPALGKLKRYLAGYRNLSGNLPCYIPVDLGTECTLSAGIRTERNRRKYDHCERSQVQVDYGTRSSRL
jgi:hypothetical protein